MGWFNKKKEDNGEHFSTFYANITKENDCSEEEAIKTLEGLKAKGLVDIKKYDNFGKPVCFEITKKGREVNACQ